MVLGEVLTCLVGDLRSGEPKPGVIGPSLLALVELSVGSLVGSSIKDIRLSDPWWVGSSISSVCSTSSTFVHGSQKYPTTRLAEELGK